MSYSGYMQEIIELAEHLASEYEEDIDPSAILKEQGVRVCFDHYGEESFEGLLEWRDSRFYAYCNLDTVPDRFSPRARFTLAHEAGHYFIDAHRNGLVNGTFPAHGSETDFRSHQKFEREADTFAAHLLMPTHKFKKAARKAGQGFTAIRKLSEKFGASMTSTSLRYLTEVLDNGALIYWNRSGVREWSWLSRDWWFDVPGTAHKNVQHLAKGSLTELAFKSDDLGKLPVSKGTTASTWFPRVKPGWRTDEILIEEVAPIGEYGFLTLLRPD